MSPSKEEYSNLCLLLTLNKLTDHPDYKVGRTGRIKRYLSKSFHSKNIILLTAPNCKFHNADIVTILSVTTTVYRDPCSSKLYLLPFMML